MLRAVCEKTEVLKAINGIDHRLACLIQKRLDDTKPSPKPHVDSGHIPESNQSMVDRLPDPADSFMSTAEVNKRRFIRYAHV